MLGSMKILSPSPAASSRDITMVRFIFFCSYVFFTSIFCIALYFPCCFSNDIAYGASTVMPVVFVWWLKLKTQKKKNKVVNKNILIFRTAGFLGICLTNLIAITNSDSLHMEMNVDLCDTKLSE